jgi:hypothetical protein
MADFRMASLQTLSCVVGASCALLLTTGCELNNTAPTTVATTTITALQGSVHGGQQAVGGATVTAYAVSNSGYGTASRVLGSTTTNSSGGFSLSAYNNCVANDLVYLVATGGNPGVSGTQNNSALAMMTGLGACSNIDNTTKVTINELTTIGTVWPLAPFMKDAAHVGTSATNPLGLTNAFNTIYLKMYDIASGVTPSYYLNFNAVFPVAEYNTLADILASCINTVDTTSPAGQSAICQSIFAAGAVNGVAPTNTIQLALNLALHPTIGLSLYAQGTPTAPYQPTLGTATAPTSWTIAIQYSFNSLDPTPNIPRGIAVDPTGYIYSAGAGQNSDSSHTNSLLEISPLTGSMIETHYTGNTIENQPSALAIDTAGDIWATDSANDSLIEDGLNAPTGGGGILTGNAMSGPNAVAIDASGYIWLTNAGNSSVSAFAPTFASSGSAATALGNFTSGIAAPVAILINPK